MVVGAGLAGEQGRSVLPSRPCQTAEKTSPQGLNFSYHGRTKRACRLRVDLINTGTHLIRAAVSVQRNVNGTCPRLV